MCDFHRNQYTSCAPSIGAYTYTTNTIPMAAPSLSDADVERIAQRVAELLKPPAAEPRLAPIIVGDAFADDSPRSRYQGPHRNPGDPRDPP